ncbi:unnamed protein product [Cylicocyclus nassatus]|uniref:Uncharacterized protein n=1 Tax=Cylicocyclus nassatus TaxID=53992 RepID=A0AA36DMJ4_CYLNA|nr:unnamed protein product [Cylicocyclus nassatus]
MCAYAAYIRCDRTRVMVRCVKDDGGTHAEKDEECALKGKSQAFLLFCHSVSFEQHLTIKQRDRSKPMDPIYFCHEFDTFFQKEHDMRQVLKEKD